MRTLDHETDGNLRVALATWIFLLHAAGEELADSDLAAACAAVAAATDASSGDAAGLALIERIAGLVDEVGTDPAAVVALAVRVIGDAVAADFGVGDRDARLSRIRGYQFRRGLPWLARVWERHPDGSVAPSWLLVSEVTDLVRVLDPNPWNDIDEERALSVHDFQVLWELDACTSLRLA
jgi:hypothetical protein